MHLWLHMGGGRSRKAVAHGGSTVFTTAARVYWTSQVHDSLCPSYPSAGVVIKPEKSYSLVSTAHTELIQLSAELKEESDMHKPVSFMLYRSDERSPVKGRTGKFPLSFRHPGWWVPNGPVSWTDVYASSPEYRVTYRLVSYLLADNWLICTLCAQCMISESNVTLSVPLILSLSISKQCIIKQLLDSVFVISWIIKVSVSVLSKSAFGSADNTYFDLDHSGYHETSSNNCLFTVFPNARSRLYLSDHQTQTCVPFDPKCWYNVRKRDKDNLPYVFSGVLCVFVTSSVKNICWVIFIHFSFIITPFGMKRCKILFFMRHFYRSLESSRELALRNAVNVWDHMSRVTSRCLEQFGWCSCGSPSLLVKATLSIFILLYIGWNVKGTV